MALRQRLDRHLKRRCSEWYGRRSPGCITCLCGSYVTGASLGGTSGCRPGPIRNTAPFLPRVGRRETKAVGQSRGTARLEGATGKTKAGDMEERT
jgi:hypothetical protein